MYVCMYVVVEEPGRSSSIQSWLASSGPPALLSSLHTNDKRKQKFKLFPRRLCSVSRVPWQATRRCESMVTVTHAWHGRVRHGYSSVSMYCIFRTSLKYERSFLPSFLPSLLLLKARSTIDEWTFRILSIHNKRYAMLTGTAPRKGQFTYVGS